MLVLQPVWWGGRWHHPHGGRANLCLDITGVPKGKLLAALYNYAVQTKNASSDRTAMTENEANHIVAERLETQLQKYKQERPKHTSSLYFDQINGVPLDVDLAKNLMEVDRYQDRNGPIRPVVLELIQERDRILTYWPQAFKGPQIVEKPLSDTGRLVNDLAGFIGIGPIFQPKQILLPK